MPDAPTFRELSELQAKFKTQGWDRLTTSERAQLEIGNEAMEEMGESPGFQLILESLKNQLGQPEAIAGMEAFEQLSPEDQERFGDWTPAQMYAVLPILDLKDMKPDVG